MAVRSSRSSKPLADSSRRPRIGNNDIVKKKFKGGKACKLLSKKAFEGSKGARQAITKAFNDINVKGDNGSKGAKHVVEKAFKGGKGGTSNCTGPAGGGIANLKPGEILTAWRIQFAKLVNDEGKSTRRRTPRLTDSAVHLNQALELSLASEPASVEAVTVSDNSVTVSGSETQSPQSQAEPLIQKKSRSGLHKRPMAARTMLQYFKSSRGWARRR